jgi:hypothetical protein
VRDRRPCSITPAFSHCRIIPRAGNVPSNAPARSASSTHRRLGFCLADLEDRFHRVMGSRGRAGTRRTSAQTAPPTGSNALRTRAWWRHGDPSGRCPFGTRLGMYTRLTGMALNASAGSCTLETSSALAFGVSTTSPSTPAVRRPALRSVTRRTLISVLALRPQHQLLQPADPWQVPRFRCREKSAVATAVRPAQRSASRSRASRASRLWSTHHADRGRRGV